MHFIQAVFHGCKKIKQRFQKANRFARTSFYMGLTLMLVLYIAGYAALLLSPYLEDSYYAVLVYHGALSTAPVVFNVGICMCMLGEYLLKHPEDDLSGK